MPIDNDDNERKEVNDKESEDYRQTIKILIFDDSKFAIQEYTDIFAGKTVDLIFSKQPDHNIQVDYQGVPIFRPDLIIMDLVMDENRNKGFELLENLQKRLEFKGVPIVVCSKLINKSPAGEKTKAKCTTQFPEVKGAYPKIPFYPEADIFLKAMKDV